MVSPETVQTAYTVLFGATTVICFGSLRSVSNIADPDTRRGLAALLSLSGLWAAGQTVHIVAATPWIEIASYTLSLVFGLATVGAWLYFCSAYAGRTYHTKPLYRRLAIGTYVAIVSFKLTNPWHNLYFETAVVQTPFPHTAIQEQFLFWVVAGLAYVLSAIGFYVLIDVFESGPSLSLRAKLVVFLAALPVAFDLIGYAAPDPILGLNYEAVGVGLFAIGTLYIVREPFFALPRYGRVQLVEDLDDPVLIIDQQAQVRDYNEPARTLFTELNTSSTVPIDDITGRLETDELTDGKSVTADVADTEKHFLVDTTPVSVGSTEVGTAVVFVDVTEIERQRRRLERKDEQLAGFATALTHELRNSVGIISGQAELISQALADTEQPGLQQRVEKITEETADIEEVVENLQALARYSQTISDTARVDLEDVIRSAKRRTDADGLAVEIEHPIELEAEKERVAELFQTMFKFASSNDASAITVKRNGDGFIIQADGRSLAEYDDQELFAYGNAVPDKDTATLLPNIRMLATVHGWDIQRTEREGTGVSLKINPA